MTTDSSALYDIDLKVLPPRDDHDPHHATLELKAEPETPGWQEAWKHATQAGRLAYVRWAAEIISRVSLQLADDMEIGQTAYRHDRGQWLDTPCPICGFDGASEMTTPRRQLAADPTSCPYVYATFHIPRGETRTWRARARDLVEEAITDDLTPALPDHQPDVRPSRTSRKKASG